MDSENCARCKNPPPSLPPDTPPAVSSPTHYSFGDVCTVQESLATPIEEIFLTTKSIKSKPWMHTRCKKNHSQLTDPSRPAPGKDRPCVIMSPPPVAANSTDPDTSICLKITLGGTAYEKLPLIVKYFAIDVASDKQPPPAGREHVHTAETCGEWPHPKQLILAFPFRTKRPIKGLWPRGRANNLPDCPERKRKPGTPLADDGVPAYKYDHDTTAWIVEKSDKLMEMWGEECEEDPNMGPIFEEDFRVRGCHSTLRWLGHADTCVSPINCRRVAKSPRVLLHW